MAKIPIIITGAPEDLLPRLPEKTEDGKELDWTVVPVLRFEKLKYEKEVANKIANRYFDWVILASVRGVRFFSELLLENEIELPPETRVAVMGQRTKELAELDGFTPDFCPSLPGTETFIEEFPKGPFKLLFASALEGRKTLMDKMKEDGSEIQHLALYSTLGIHPIQSISQQQLSDASLILFTSPSSFDAFTDSFEIPRKTKIGCLGQYTFDHLTRKGISGHRKLPEGDFRKIGDILC